MSITEIAPTYEKMSLTELHRDAAANFKKSEEIVADLRRQNREPNDDERKALKDIINVVDSIEAVISRKESDASMFNRVAAGTDKYSRPYAAFPHAEPTDRDEDGRERRGQDRRTIGQRFVGSPEYKAAYGGRAVTQATFKHVAQEYEHYSLTEHKTLLMGAASPGGGPLVENDRQPLVRDERRPLTFLDLITRLTTDSDTIEWPEESFTNAAATVAEATATTGASGTKPESALTYTLRTSPVEAIAHWIPVTMRMLADFSGIRGLIDMSLMVGLDETLETQILTGDGSSPNLDGLTHLTGVQAHALGSDSTLDALFKMMVKVQVTGRSQPTGVVMNPLNFQGIRLARENAATGTLGGYLYGSPALAGPMTVWGRPVVEAQGLTANTALVGDFSARRMILWDREQAIIRTGYVNDDFIRNIIRMLAELRAAFTVFRQSAVCKVTGLS